MTFGVLGLLAVAGRMKRGSFAWENKKTNNAGVARAWSEGRDAHNSNRSFWTNGEDLYSYNLKIGETVDGVKRLYDFSAKSGMKVSATTSKHVGFAKPYAELWTPPGTSKTLLGLSKPKRITGSSARGRAEHGNRWGDGPNSLGGNRTNNAGVARSWSHGRAAHNNNQSYWTDGKDIYSYELKIGETRSGGTKVLWDYTAAGGDFRSMTTSTKHVCNARSYADEIWSPPSDETRNTLLGTVSVNPSKRMWPRY
jgi:hypothetical protein